MAKQKALIVLLTASLSSLKRQCSNGRSVSVAGNYCHLKDNAQTAGISMELSYSLLKVSGQKVDILNCCPDLATFIQRDIISR